MNADLLFIVGSDKKWEEEQLVSSGIAAGYDTKILLASDITIILEESQADILHSGKSIRDDLKASRIVFRRTRGNIEMMITLAILADHWAVPHTDSRACIMNNLHKLMSIPAVSLRNIKHIPTTFTGQNSVLDTKQYTLPLLAKPVTGRHGEGIEILETPEQFSSFLSCDHSHKMLQKFLHIDEEYRVFVIGDIALDVIKKIPKDGSKIANYAAGAQFTLAEVPAEIEQEAIEVCKQQGIDIGGVDLARVDEDFYLLEVNRCPEFRAFTDTTSINVSEKIIDFLVKK